MKLSDCSGPVVGSRGPIIGRDVAARRRGRRPCLETLESRQLLSATSISEFPTPTVAAGPEAITSGPDGNFWFIESGADKIGTINPTTDVITEFSLPTAGALPLPTAGPELTGIASGPDGNLWFTEFGAGKIGMINPTTHAIKEFPLLPDQNPSAITAGPDGNLWFTETGAEDRDMIGMINPTTHAISEFEIPTTGGYAAGIVAGPDGNLWFTELVGTKIGEINPTTHAISEYPVPTAATEPEPEGIAAGPDGNLWFTEFQGDKIGMINPTTHAIAAFPVPTTAAQPTGIAVGPDGDLWFTEYGANNIGMINPTTDAITEFAIPTASSKPSGIAAGPDGNLLFAESGSSRIGVVTPGTSLAVTTEPPASVTLGQSFGLTVSVNDLSGSVDTDYNGPVTVALVNTGTATLGGTLTVNATDGVATFSGLSINQSGTGYVLMASTNAQTTADTTPVAVSLTTMIVVLPPPVAPTIVAGQVLYAGKRLHKHVVGFQLDFSEALASTAAQDAANYAVTRIVKHRHKPAMKAVRLASAMYNTATDSVTLTLARKGAFAAGGRIVANAASPAGITDTLGEYLDGNGKGVAGVNATLVISKKARGITLMS